MPAVGRVEIRGEGLSSSSKTANGREVITVKLHQKKAGRLRTKVSVHFTPKKGKKQSGNR